MKIVIQNHVFRIRIPRHKYFEDWAEQVLRHLPHKNLNAKTKVFIRFVSVSEITSLNTVFKGKETSTNILSFPSDLTGDIAICPSVINEEAINMSLVPLSYWSHIFIHGLLHLFGFNHEKEGDAEVMESLEKEIMFSLR